MAFQPVPDTCQVSVIFRMDAGHETQFSMYSRNTLAGWGLAQQQELRESVRDAVIADYLPVLSDEIDFIRIETRRLDQEFGLSTSEVIDPAEPGTLASPKLPANVSVFAGFIGDPGQAPRSGGMFLMPPAENQVEASLLNAAAQAALAAAVDELGAAAGPSSAAQVIVSRYAGTELVPHPDGTIRKRPVKREPVALTNTLQARQVRQRVNTQRKRLQRIDPLV